MLVVHEPRDGEPWFRNVGENVHYFIEMLEVPRTSTKAL